MSGEERMNLLEQLTSALESAKKFDGNYAPIYNSKTMLSEIEKHLRQPDYLRKHQDELNVGLLAAKTLDFDSSFSDYAGILHKLWQDLLSLIKKEHPPLPLKEREKEEREKARIFYEEKAGYTPHQIQNHLSGIDFSKSVDDKFPIPKGKQIAQWKAPGIAQGGYYTEKCDKPFCLGIYHYQESRKNGSIKKRIQDVFEADREIIVLKSIAANVLDTWSIKGCFFRASGGCTQYFYVMQQNELKELH